MLPFSVDLNCPKYFSVISGISLAGGVGTKVMVGEGVKVAVTVAEGVGGIEVKAGAGVFEEQATRIKVKMEIRGK